MDIIDALTRIQTALEAERSAEMAASAAWTLPGIDTGAPDWDKYKTFTDLIEARDDAKATMDALLTGLLAAARGLAS